MRDTAFPQTSTALASSWCAGKLPCLCLVTEGAVQWLAPLCAVCSRKYVIVLISSQWSLQGDAERQNATGNGLCLSALQV